MYKRDKFTFLLLLKRERFVLDEITAKAAMDIPERIVDKRIKERKTEYLIKWVGWSLGDNSWETTDTLLKTSEGRKLYSSYEGLSKKSLKKELKTRSEQTVVYDVCKKSLKEKKPEEDKVYDKVDIINLSKRSVLRGNVWRKPRKVSEILKINKELNVLCSYPDEVEEMLGLMEVRKHCPELLIDFLEEQLISSMKDSTESNKNEKKRTEKETAKRRLFSSFDQQD